MTTKIDKLIPLAEVATYFPIRPSYGTLLRWISVGVGGVKLGSVAVAGRRYCSPKQIQAFVAGWPTVAAATATRKEWRASCSRQNRDLASSDRSGPTARYAMLSLVAAVDFAFANADGRPAEVNPPLLERKLTDENDEIALAAPQEPKTPQGPDAAQDQLGPGPRLHRVSGRNFAPAAHPGRVLIVAWRNDDVPTRKSPRVSGRNQHGGETRNRKSLRMAVSFIPHGLPKRKQSKKEKAAEDRYVREALRLARQFPSYSGYKPTAAGLRKERREMLEFNQFLKASKTRSRNHVYSKNLRPVPKTR